MFEGVLCEKNVNTVKIIKWNDKKHENYTTIKITLCTETNENHYGMYISYFN
jgi:hypothetical protein